MLWRNRLSHKSSTEFRSSKPLDATLCAVKNTSCGSSLAAFHSQAEGDPPHQSQGPQVPMKFAQPHRRWRQLRQLTPWVPPGLNGILGSLGKAALAHAMEKGVEVCPAFLSQLEHPWRRVSRGLELGDPLQNLCQEGGGVVRGRGCLAEECQLGVGPGSLSQFMKQVLSIHRGSRLQTQHSLKILLRCFRSAA